MNGLLANGFVLQAVPALIGAFVGAPLLARELETGTFRYAWTQGFGRWRWTLAKLVLLAVVVAAAAGAISVLFSWYYQPYFAAGNQTLFLTEASPLAPGLFDLRGVAFAAWTLAAFAIGALAGMLIRRVVPAIVATLVAYAGLALAAGMFLRQHYLTPLVTSNLNVPGSAWIIEPVVDARAASSRSASRCSDQPPPAGMPPAAGRERQAVARHLRRSGYLVQHGYTRWTSYQPASRFWPFQWIEGGWLLALSLLLIAATVWLVRRAASAPALPSERRSHYGRRVEQTKFLLAESRASAALVQHPRRHAEPAAAGAASGHRASRSGPTTSRRSSRWR